MMEEDVIACPVCHKELFVRFIQRKTITYIVPKDCPHCKTSADKLEKMLNKGQSRTRVQTEKSYLKVDPRG